jgi:NAD(P)-dependent dehydrogenase (short-subunit alcohol dehydrogenase family)
VLVAGCGNIGGAVARRFALAGVPVVVTYRENTERAEGLARELRACGADVLAQRLDFADAAAVKDIVGLSAERFGRLHTVVYCSGPAIPFLRVREMAPDMLAQHLHQTRSAVSGFPSRHSGFDGRRRRGTDRLCDDGKSSYPGD